MGGFPHCAVQQPEFDRSGHCLTQKELASTANTIQRSSDLPPTGAPKCVAAAIVWELGLRETGLTLRGRLRLSEKAPCCRPIQPANAHS